MLHALLLALEKKRNLGLARRVHVAGYVLETRRRLPGAFGVGLCATCVSKGSHKTQHSKDFAVIPNADVRQPVQKCIRSLEEAPKGLFTKTKHLPRTGHG